MSALKNVLLSVRKLKCDKCHEVRGGDLTVCLHQGCGGVFRIVGLELCDTVTVEQYRKLVRQGKVIQVLANDVPDDMVEEVIDPPTT